MNQIRGSEQLQIGTLIFTGVDQIDFTGPFEVFPRLPGATYHVIAKDRKPIRDTRGLILTPEKTYFENKPVRPGTRAGRPRPGGVDGR